MGRLTKTTKEYVSECIKVHGDKYAYDSVQYKGAHSKIIITCPIHGKFQQSANNHLRGQGCSKCSVYNRTDNVEEFIIKAEGVHEGRYDYPASSYKNNYTKIPIVCREHGVFMQSPRHHIGGSGCPRCADRMMSKISSKNPSGWTCLNWQLAANKSKNFDSFKVYIIKCWNDEEMFYKIGRTFTTIKHRFRSKSLMPYRYEIIEVYDPKDAKATCDLEKQLHSVNKEYKYTPSIKFKGVYECFEKYVIELTNKKK